MALGLHAITAMRYAQVLGTLLMLLVGGCSDPSGPVQCDYKGTFYDDGEVFPAGDGCNTCTCNPSGLTPGTWRCSLIACQDAGAGTAADLATSTPFPASCEGEGGSTVHGGTLRQGESCCTCSAPGTSPPTLQCLPRDTTTKCNYNGTLYDDGEVFPAGDGCNTCKCNPTGCMPGRWGCSLVGCHDGGPPDAPIVDAPPPVDQSAPNDGPAPDYLRAEHPGACPLLPPTEGDACSLPSNAACSYRPICEAGMPVDRHCDCIDDKWSCSGGHCGEG